MSAAAKKRRTSTIALADPKTHVGGSTEKFRRLRRADRCHRRELLQEDRRAYGDHASGRSHQPFDAPGQYFDQESALDQNWHRTYDTRTGRYAQEDPYVSDLAVNLELYAEMRRLNHPYTYVGASPLSFIDVLGLCRMLVSVATSKKTTLEQQGSEYVSGGSHSACTGFAVPTYLNFFDLLRTEAFEYTRVSYEKETPCEKCPPPSVIKNKTGETWEKKNRLMFVGCGGYGL